MENHCGDVRNGNISLQDLPAPHLLSPDHPLGVSGGRSPHFLEMGDLRLFSGYLNLTWLMSPFFSPFSLPTTQPASFTGTRVSCPKKQDKVKKRVIWGIEVAEELHWKGWALGKEVTKNLTLKNLSLKIQKMKYRCQNEGSETQPLSPQAPQTVTLSGKKNPTL